MTGVDKEDGVDLNNQNVMGPDSDASHFSSNSVQVPLVESDLASKKLDEASVVNTSFSILCTTKETTCRGENGESSACSGGLAKGAPQIEETAAILDILKLEQKSTASEELLPELRCKAENMCDQQKLVEEATGQERQLLEKELELLKEAVGMALDNEHSVSFYIEQLNEQIETRRHNLQELENEWDVFRKPLEEKRWNLLESFCATNAAGQLKLQQIKEIEVELHSVVSETRKRDEECAKLAADLKKQPKVASRRSYIQRITEITKNSRKLDADIERILKDTRELKLESNSIEERLHRTYAVVDEKVFREAKRDSVGHHAYRLLTSIHESFAEIREKILSTNKAQREVAELEARLSVISARRLDVDKLQADLDAMRLENERLEKTLQNY